MVVGFVRDRRLLRSVYVYFMTCDSGNFVAKRR
jgi:hypothetical protein